MKVESIHDGYAFDEVQENCGFAHLKTGQIEKTEPPTDEELRILRHEVDPNGYIIGR